MDPEEVKKYAEFCAHVNKMVFDNRPVLTQHPNDPFTLVLHGEFNPYEYLAVGALVGNNAKAGQFLFTDSSDYVARVNTWLISVDLCGPVKERSTMPTIVEVTAYTYAELEEAHPKGFERAQAKLAEWNTETIFEDFKGDEVASIVEGYPAGVSGGKRYPGTLSGYTNVKLVDWSLGDGPHRDYVAFKADVDQTVLVNRLVRAGKLTKRDRWLLRSFEWWAHVTTDRYGFSRDQRSEGRTENQQDDTPKREAVLNKLAEVITEDCKDYARKVCQAYQDELEYRQSDEALKEMAEANEWLFDASGRIVG